MENLPGLFCDVVLSCTCKRLGDVYSRSYLALTGATEQAGEFLTDRDCPMHGGSKKALEQREAALEVMRQRYEAQR